MPRIRTIFNSEIVYAGPSPASGYHYGSTLNGAGLFASTGSTLIQQLTRVQSFNFGANAPKKDVQQFGELAAIDRVPVDTPTVSAEVQYLSQSLFNERLLGFSICSGGNVTSAISGFLAKNTDERNVFAKIVGEGQDANDNATNSFGVVGLGNMSVTSYSAEGAVGDFPKVTVGFEGLNLKFDTQTGLSIPAVNPLNGANINNINYALPTGFSDPSGSLGGALFSVLKPGDIYLSVQKASDGSAFADGFFDFSDLKVQNYQLSFSLARTPILKLGSNFAVSREINVPVNIDFKVNGIVGDYASGSLAENIKKNVPYNVVLNINKPAYSYGSAVADTGVAVQYLLKQAYLDDQQYSLGIGGNQTVSLSFVCPMGGPQDIAKGLFLSGIN